MRDGCWRRDKARMGRRGKKCDGFGHKAVGLHFVLRLSKNNKAWANVGICQ